MAVLAAQYGAKKVYAIENDPRTYKILEHLIYKSSYDHIITCVEDTFCMSTSVYNNADVFIQYMTNSEPKLLELVDEKTFNPLTEGTRAYIVYEYYEKVDPNFSG